MRRQSLQGLRERLGQGGPYLGTGTAAMLLHPPCSPAPAPAKGQSEEPEMNAHREPLHQATAEALSDATTVSI